MTNDNSRDLAEMNDDVALLVRLAGPTGLTGPVAADRAGRRRTERPWAGTGLRRVERAARRPSGPPGEDEAAAHDRHAVRRGGIRRRRGGGLPQAGTSTSRARRSRHGAGRGVVPSIQG